jgi:N-formylglutamate amidohydrolase
MYLIHLPHCGLDIPKEYIKDYYLSEDELKANILEYADLYTDELFEDYYNYFGGVKNGYSRLFFDPERFERNEDEEMYKKYRLGWFYEMAILEKKPLRSLKNKEKIRKYYKTHHEKLEKLTEEKLIKNNEVTIIDCHSFSDRGYWFFEKLDFPDICIGYDEFHKNEELIELIENEFKGYKIAHNFPYAGSLVPLKYYLKDKRIKSVMIEINKRVYLEKDNITKSSNFSEIKTKLNNILMESSINKTV